MSKPWEDASLCRRIDAKTDRDEGNCWVWSAGTIKGRAAIQYEGSYVSAPRLAKVIADKCWPSDISLQACHSCDNPDCVNPDHIWWGSNTENSHDAVRKKRLWKQKATHCVKGHLLSGENLRMSKGHRVCRACASDRQKKWRSTASVGPTAIAQPSSEPTP